MVCNERYCLSKAKIYSPRSPPQELTDFCGVLRDHAATIAGDFSTPAAVFHLMAERESFDTLAERMVGLRSAVDSMNEAILKHIEDDNQQQGQLRASILSLTTLASSEAVHRQNNANAIEDIKKDFVTRETFAPVKLIAYGAAGILLTAIVAAIVKGIL